MVCAACRTQLGATDSSCPSCGAPAGSFSDDAPTAGSVVSAVAPVAVGERVAHRYRLQALVGRGSFGDVYRALDEELGRTVAVKVLRLAPPVEEEETRRMVARFRAEARVMARLQHPAIVPIYDVGAHGGVPFFVMSYLEGATLAETLGRHGPMALDQALAIFAAAAGAMAYAHHHGVVHRDLKPGNLFLDQAGHPYILDFGLAKLRDVSSESSSGRVVGTVLYMSPEQLLHGDIDGRSDIFSLGVMLYLAVTGSHPFSGPVPLTAILYQEPAAARTLCPELPLPLDRVLRRAMAKERSRRYRSMDELQSDLGLLLKALRDGTSGELALKASAPDPDAFERPALCGRGLELERIENDLAEAAAGIGRTVLLSGEAGVGKSRLIEELAGRAALRGIRVYTARPLAADGSYPYQPVLEVISAWTAERRLDSAAALEEFASVRAPALKPALGILESLLFFAADEGAAVKREAVWEAIDRVVKTMADERPVVIHIDGLERADPATLRLLRYLALANRRTRLLLVLSYRPGEAPEAADATLGREVEALASDLRGEPNVRALGLAPLAPEDARHLARALLDPSEEGQAAAERVAEASDGNPLFLLETLRWLEHEGKVKRGDGTWVVCEPVAYVPTVSGVRTLLLGRIERLEPAYRELLDLAAVEGENFSSETLADGLARPKRECLRTLHELEKRHSIVRFCDGTYRFEHARLREVLYDELNPELRAALHGEVAVSYEKRGRGPEEWSARIARHWELAGSPERASRQYAVAAEVAVRARLTDEAVKLYGRALNLAGAGEQCELRARRGELHFDRGEFGPAADDLAGALAGGALAGSHTPAARGLEVAARLALAELVTGKVSEAKARAAEVLIQAGDTAPGVAVLALRCLGTAALHYEHRIEAAEAALARAGTLARDSGLHSEVGRIEVLWSKLERSRGRRHEVTARRERARAAFALAGQGRGVADLLLEEAIELCERGRAADAEVRWREAASLYHQCGFLPGRISALQNSAFALVMAGEVAAGRGELEALFAETRALGLDMLLAWGEYYLGWVARLEGRFQAVREHLGRSLGAAASLRVLFDPVELEIIGHNQLIATAIACGRADRARTHVEAGRELLEKLGPQAPQAIEHGVESARAAVASGDLDGARRDLDAVAREARRARSVRMAVDLRIVRGELELAAGSLPAARECVRVAAWLARRIGCALSHAEALLVRGRVELAAGGAQAASRVLALAVRRLSAQGRRDLLWRALALRARALSVIGASDEEAAVRVQAADVFHAVQATLDAEDRAAHAAQADAAEVRGMKHPAVVDLT